MACVDVPARRPNFLFHLESLEDYTMQTGLTTVSLFSGCGGSDLGARRAGAQIIFANDNYAPAVATYRRHQRLIAGDDVDLRECDIKDIRTFPKGDLLLGCYPCQSFTMGGPRNPDTDPRTDLYMQFTRCLVQTKPRFFVAENVTGLKWLSDGVYLDEQLESFLGAGGLYRISTKILDAKDYGVPADRRRLFIVGVRRDQFAWYRFPAPTHGDAAGLRRYESHGEALQGLPLDAARETYDEGRQPFSWWFMSRNRKRPWNRPAFTVVANWRHVTLHPASPLMRLVSSNWRDGSKQTWEFTGDYDVPDGQDRLPEPRRLSWRECSVLQSFPRTFAPSGSIEQKYLQIGNAVPPLLMQRIVEGLVSGKGLVDKRPDYGVGRNIRRPAA
jgi:DNA (cytosine-5)-methyltransferase 1